MQGAEDQRQLGHPVTPPEPRPGGPRAPSPCLIPTRPNVPTSGRSPCPSITPLPSIPTCCHPTTYPVSPPPCQWPPPQSRLTCPPGQFPNRDPRPVPSALLPLGSPVPQRGWTQREPVSMLRSVPTRSPPPLFPQSPRQLAPSCHPVGPRQEGRGARCLPAGDGVAAPCDGHHILSRHHGVVLTLEHTVPSLPHLHGLLCAL